MPPESPHLPGRLASLDLLRGFACLAVVLFHYCSRGPAGGWMLGLDVPWLEGIARYGYLGVHLFFLLSGFVILYSASQASPRAFLASRIARLYPAFWIAVPLTALIVWLAQDTRLLVSPVAVLGNLSMFAHWLRLPWVDGVYWSLAVELHFYLYVWLLLCLRRLHWLEPLLAAWLLVSLVDFLRPMYPVEFWLNAKWAPFFVGGCILYRLRSAGYSHRRLALLLAAALLAIAWAVKDSTGGLTPDLPFNPVVVAALVALMFILMSVLTLGRPRLRASGLTTLIGALTYPVYLLHQNIGYVLYDLLRPLGFGPWSALLLISLLVLGLAWTIHRAIEQPLAPRLRRWVGGTASRQGQAAVRV